jgi:ankyrin repeat protein
MHKQFLLALLWLMQSSLFAQPASPLFAALEKNDTVALKNLLGSGANPNAADADSDNVLMYAALYSSANTMKLLLDNKADPNQPNKLGETPLMWCTHDLEKVKLLLKSGAQINAVTKSGNTPVLVAAIGYNQLPVVQYLADHGADCHALNNFGENALMRAAEYGDTSLLQFLFSKGIDATAKDHDSSNALLNAAENIPATRWLINKIKQTEATDSMFAEALTFAVVEDEPAIVKAMTQKIKNIDWSDREGYTSLMWAVYNEHVNPEMIKILIGAGADLQHLAKDGTNALYWAKKKGNTAVVQLLIQSGAK